MKPFKVVSIFKDTWLLEISSVLSSVVSYGILVHLLMRYNQQPIFSWHGISLNTWAAVLSTIGKSMLMFAISAGISQWKYIWFSQGRKTLLDFDSFDNASRGPNGSISLLWNHNIRSLVSVGAAITILSLAIDPFVQLVVGVENHQVPASQDPVSIPRAVRYSKGTWILLDDVNSVEEGCLPVESIADFPMQSAIFFGLTNTVASVSQQTASRCPSAHCEWPPYLSLSVCSTCTNVTSLLTHTTRTAESYIFQDELFEMTDPWSNPALEAVNTVVDTYGFPNGLYIDVSVPASDVSLLSYGTNNRSNTVSFQKNQLLLWSMTMLSKVGSTVSATECGLTYCVKNYSSQVVNGTLIERTYSMPFNMTPGSWTMQDYGGPDEHFPGVLNAGYDDLRYDLQLGGLFNITQKSIFGIGTALESLFINSAAGRNISQLGATGFYLGPNSNQGTYFPTSMQPLHESTDLNETFTALAMSMSNAIRANDDNATVVEGTTSITVYKVRWIWVTLPFANVLGGVVFIMFAVLRTHQRSLSAWKSSTLPVLKFGAQMGTSLEHKSLISELEESAGNITVRLSGADEEEFFGEREDAKEYNIAVREEEAGEESDQQAHTLNSRSTLSPAGEQFLESL